MINLEENMSWKDISQWLRGGWFLFKRASGNGPLEAARVISWPPWDEPSFNASTGSLYIQTAGGAEESRTYDELPECIFPHWPGLGSINVTPQKYAAHYSRVQSKQWQRTYNSTQIRVTLPKKKEAAKLLGALDVHPNQRQNVNEAFFPTYPTLDEVRARFEDGWASVALTPTLIVTNTTPRFVYFRGQIAAAIRDSKLISINERLVRRVEKVLGNGGIEL